LRAYNVGSSLIVKVIFPGDPAANFPADNLKNMRE
jgi:hypothetical protein